MNELFSETLEVVPLQKIPQFRIIGSKYNILFDLYRILKRKMLQVIPFSTLLVVVL